MRTESLLLWVVIGLLAGWVASKILGGSGLLRYLAAGVLGAIVGNMLVSYFNINIPVDNALVKDFLVATGGAMIVILVARVVA